MAMTDAHAKVAKDSPARIGTRGRVGGLGQEYTVVGVADATTMLIEVKTWDEPLRYPTADVEQDVLGVCKKDRFQQLVGQCRSMGPAGPEYEVVSIENSTLARIWVVGNEENEDYQIEDILIDPLIFDGK